jgi:diguanylate cyclase (GGDEF)-like protein
MVYATSYLFEISAINLEEITFFLNMEYVGILFIPVFWVLIAWSYHPENPTYNQTLVKKLRILYAIPILANILVWTNDRHQFVYHDIRIDRNLPISLLDVDRAPGFWVVNGMIVALYLAGTLRMVYNLIKARKSDHRSQYLLLTLSSIPPFISYMLVLKQAVPHGLDLNPIAFALSGLLLFWGMVNLNLFDIASIAQSMVINAMGDAMIVLDSKGNLIDSNRQARIFFPPSDDQTHHIGAPIKQLNPALDQIFSQINTSKEAEITVPTTSNIRRYAISRSTITDKRSRTRGTLFLMHDVTEIHTYISELEFLAAYDGLTNLLNHRQFMKSASEKARMLKKKASGQFSLIMFDLDHFKTINDTYGHTTGDTVLERIGKMIASYASKEDLCARYGGEEFVMLLWNTSTEKAYEVADRLRQEIESAKFDHEQEDMRMSASFGISNYTPSAKYTWEVSLNQADTALYEAKKAGRNCVKVYTPR